MNLDQQEGETPDIHMVPSEPNLSTSILTLPSFLISNTPPRQPIAPVSYKILPAFHDPIFHTYTFNIPESLSGMLRESLPFTFQTVPHSRIEIFRDSTLISFYDILFYGNEIMYESIIIFVINKKKYLRTAKLEQSKEYKRSIAENRKYVESSELSEYEERLKHLQIRDGLNLFFIESCEDIISSLKAIVKGFCIKRNYIPKVKAFRDPNMYLRYVISRIPGIGRNVGNAVGDRFGTLADFYCYLVDEEAGTKTFQDFIVYSEDRMCSRKLGLKQANIIRVVLLSKNGNEII